MSDERAATAGTERTERPATTAEVAHGDREAETSDERRTAITPSDLAMARAIIDAALARRS